MNIIHDNMITVKTSQRKFQISDHCMDHGQGEEDK